ncbi:MAG TPA: hypothetical protein DCP63_06345, partial [Bacteroidetes bacterium]|nr:hypothetical protein [Bacteroidota bacterium]
SLTSRIEFAVRSQTPNPVPLFSDSALARRSFWRDCRTPEGNSNLRETLTIGSAKKKICVRLKDG